MNLNHPMYLIGLTTAAYIGWKKLAETFEAYDNALQEIPDKPAQLNDNEGEALEAWTDPYSHDIRTDNYKASYQNADYRDPANWHVDRSFCHDWDIDPYTK